MVKIYIDPGHGGNDPGASANGLKEKDLTLSISKRIKKYLDANYSGHTTKLSRSTDKTLTLPQRTNDANLWGADYFLSVHINAGGGTGFETYTYDGKLYERTLKIQSIVHQAVMNQIKGVTDRGAKRKNLHVVREANASACLTENLFIDTKSDADKLKDGKFLDNLAKGHAIGLAKAFDLKGKGGSTNAKPSTKPKPKPSKPTPKPSKPSTPKANLKVDGSWGNATTRALQKALGTVVDGVISGQSRKGQAVNLYGSVTYGTSGSDVIRALQRKIGATVDGSLGPATVRKLQAYLGTSRDGVISTPYSSMVAEMQRKLNSGTF